MHLSDHLCYPVWQVEAKQLTPLAEKLAQVKGENGAQSELARYLEVSPTTVYRWTKGGVRPIRAHRKQVVRWLRANGVDVQEKELWP